MVRTDITQSHTVNSRALNTSLQHTDHSGPKHKVGKTSIEVRPDCEYQSLLNTNLLQLRLIKLRLSVEGSDKKILNNSMYIKVCLITFSEVLQQSLPRETRALSNDRL